MYDFDVAIIGAGVIGLSASYFLSRHTGNILVLEKNNTFGMETSSRNSEVVHSGIYYPEESMKSKFCNRGRILLYEFCNNYGIDYIKRGKFIVATNDDEEVELLKLFKSGVNKGIEGLYFLSKKELSVRQPEIKGISAIFSEETGVFDSHSFMKKLFFLSKNRGAIYAFNKEVVHIESMKGYYKIYCRDGDRTSSKVVVNASGLSSDKIASMVGIEIDRWGYRLKYYKGDYFYYSKKPIIDKLVYPVPMRNLKGLGIHITIDLSGRMKFGPDAYPVDRISYDLDETKRDKFYQSASKLIRGLKKDFVFPDTSGIRPKLSGDEFRDFIVCEESGKGFPRFINTIGIESHGLTSSLAIGEYISKLYCEI